jgi:hypothetical protein
MHARLCCDRISPPCTKPVHIVDYAFRLLCSPIRTNTFVTSTGLKATTLADVSDTESAAVAVNCVVPLHGCKLFRLEYWCVATGRYRWCAADMYRCVQYDPHGITLSIKSATNRMAPRAIIIFSSHSLHSPSTPDNVCVRTTVNVD